MERGKEAKKRKDTHPPFQYVIHGVALMQQGRSGCCRSAYRRCRRRKMETRSGGGREEGRVEGHDEGVAEEGKESGGIPGLAEGLR